MPFLVYWLTIVAAILLVPTADLGWRALLRQPGDPLPLAAGVCGVVIGLALQRLHARLSRLPMPPGRRRLLLCVHALLAMAVYAAVSFGYTLLLAALPT